MGGGGVDQKAQEKLASRSACPFGAVGGATDLFRIWIPCKSVWIRIGPISLFRLRIRPENWAKYRCTVHEDFPVAVFMESAMNLTTLYKKIAVDNRDHSGCDRTKNSGSTTPYQRGCFFRRFHNCSPSGVPQISCAEENASGRHERGELWSHRDEGKEKKL
jgi:hypothetical protein